MATEKMTTEKKLGEVILSVKDLKVNFRAYGGLVQAVRGISFDLHRGETLAIVGESGSGKSVSIKAIMGILANNAIIESGEILYDGMDLTKVKEDAFHEIRGKRIGLIFQDPLSALNPIMKIGKQITEVLRINQHMSKDPHLRRAHHRSGRDRSGQDPGAHQRHQGKASSLRHLHHPRPGRRGQHGRPGQRHVRGQDRGDGYQ